LLVGFRAYGKARAHVVGNFLCASLEYAMYSHLSITLPLGTLTMRNAHCRQETPSQGSFVYRDHFGPACPGWV